MRKTLLILFINFFITFNAFAQEDSEDKAEKKFKSYAIWGLALSSIQWNEPMMLQQGLTFADDSANYSGTILTLQREVNHSTWGWAVGIFAGSGHAVGGGNAQAITYQKSKVPFSVYGISPRLFTRLSGRINAGISLNAFLKEITWPNESADLVVDSGRKMNATAIFDLNVRVFRNWDFYSGIGPLGEGGTLWKIGINYRF